jgi:ribonucleotide monophosphatase NagD (HAD superfamily)
MLALASGVPAVYVGKPYRYAFDLALEGMALSCDQVVMVGDRVNTDIQGANDLGMRSVLVKTGEFDASELHAAAPRPDYVIDAIANLPGLGIF